MILNHFPEPVLVVGGTGFLGERVVMRLCRAGAKVRVLTRHPGSFAAVRLRKMGAEVYYGDATRRWTLWEAMIGCGSVVSCAHVRHTPEIVQACYRLDVPRLVVMSSTRRYSQVPSAGVGEVIAGERAATDSDLDWTILRASMLYGSSRDRNVARLMQWTRRFTFVLLPGGGSARLQPLYVEDAAQALLNALRNPDTARRDYTITGPEAVTYRELATKVLRACDRGARMIPVPLGLMLLAVRLSGGMGARLGLGREQVLRLGESKVYEPTGDWADLGFVPRALDDVLSAMAAGQTEVESLYGVAGLPRGKSNA